MHKSFALGHFMSDSSATADRTLRMLVIAISEGLCDQLLGISARKQPHGGQGLLSGNNHHLLQDKLDMLQLKFGLQSLLSSTRAPDTPTKAILGPWHLQPRLECRCGWSLLSLGRSDCLMSCMQQPWPDGDMQVLPNGSKQLARIITQSG